MAEQEENPKIEVNLHALFQVLQALNGPDHLILELKATRSRDGLFKDNAIDVLIKDYNAWVTRPATIPNKRKEDPQNG